MVPLAACVAMHRQLQDQASFRYRTFVLMREATLGTGSYGQVCRAMLDELPCAAKLLHPVLVDPTDPQNQTILRRFEQECSFLGEIRHPNIVQFLGMVQDEESGLPVLLMELMDNSLTYFLEQSEEPLAYHVQVNISHDIALALAYLHSNYIVHRDLSSNNVLLIGPGCRAKVTDFGMSKLTDLYPRLTPMTQCPGTAAYMPPEALVVPPVYTEKLDCFQVGVLVIQIITRKFPNPTDAMHRMEDSRFPSGWVNVPVPEVERRHNHICLVPEIHPMLRLALDCLKDKDRDRPTAEQICRQLSALKNGDLYADSTLHHEGGIRDGEGIGDGRLIRTPETQDLKHKLELKELALEQLQKELEQKNCILQEKEQKIYDQEQIISRLQLHPSSTSSTSYTCQVNGPGLLTATVNYPTHVFVELTDASGQLCSHKQNVTAKFEPKLSLSKANDSGWWLWSGKSQTTPGKPLVTVSVRSPSRYHIAYTAAIRGQHRLHIQLNGREVSSNPFNITVYPDPTQLGAPVRVITGLNHPYRVTINSHGELLVSEWSSHQVSVLDAKGKRTGSFGCVGHEPEHVWHPTGVAIDGDGNVFVASHHKLQKFSPSGQLMKCVGQKGDGEGEFRYPLGITFHSNRVYVCDEDNGRIQVFDTDLNFKQSIGSCGSGTGQFS